MNLPRYISVSDFNKSEDFIERHKMVNDIPRVDYRYLDYKLGWQDNPVTVSQFALCLYDEYTENMEKSKYDRFFHAVKWLINYRKKISADAAALPYNFPNNMYDLIAPWYSGMAQGQATSVFVRAFILTGKKDYLKYAEELINFMLMPVHEGGTLIQTPEGLPWIEECTTKEPSLILNGHLYALIGLAEYINISKDNQYNEIFQSLIGSTIKLIPLYEKNNWLIYARKYSRKACTNKYMGLQVLEVKQLYQLVHLEDFNIIHDRWEKFIDWNKFWEDIRIQNSKSYYFFRNLKGIIKNMFPSLYKKYKRNNI